MSNKLLILLTLTSFLQLNRAETVNDVINALRPQIRAVKAQVGQTIADGGRKIGLARSEIAQIVNDAEENVQLELDELRELSNQIKNQANIEGKHIEECLEHADAALKALNINSVQNCRESDDLNLIGLQLGDLGKLKGTLSRAIDLCSSKSTDPAEVRNCIQNEIDEAKKQVVHCQETIEKISRNSVNGVRDCAQNGTTNLINGLEKIGEGLKSCAENA